MQEDMHILTVKLHGFIAILIRPQTRISHLYSELVHHFIASNMKQTFTETIFYK